MRRIVVSFPSHDIADKERFGLPNSVADSGNTDNNFSAISMVILTASLGSRFGSCLAILEARDCSTYNDASLAAATVPECIKSTLRLGPAFIPLMHKSGFGSPL